MVILNKLVVVVVVVLMAKCWFRGGVGAQFPRKV